MFFDVTKVEYVAEYRIRLLFEDGLEGIADLSSYPDPGNVFKGFLDLEYFRQFRIEYGTLVWGDGDVDIAPETLYTLATGNPVEYQQTSIKA